MQSEIPTVLNVFDTDYQLEYSESYSGTVHQEIAIEGYQYCTSLPRAFESLIFESYTNFILTVGCITVIVIWGSKYLILMQEICMVEGSLKVRVLLEVPSLDSLVHYFQSIHNNDIFEVRGVQIENIQNRMVSQNSLNETINFNLSCAVALYSLYYPIMKSCNYWNIYNSSLPTIVDKGKKMCCKSSLEHNQQSPANLPRTVDVCETEVNLDNLFKSEGLLTDSLQSKSILENEIIHNSECTGFLISFSSYCISCTFKPTKRSKHMYSPLLYNKRDTSSIQYTKTINGMASLVDAIRKILEKYNTLGQYRILFGTCSCKVVDRKERKKLMIKHRKKNNIIKEWSQQRKKYSW